MTFYYILAIVTPIACYGADRLANKIANAKK